MRPLAAQFALASVSIEPLVYLTVALLLLSLLTGLLALVLRMVDGRRIAVRAWLALAWLASLVVPALAEGAFVALYELVRRIKSPPLYTLTDSQYTVARIAVLLTAFALTIACIAWLTRRNVLRPLAAMSQAARQIAGGNPDITLLLKPAPQLREVAAVAEAFAAMSAGLQQSIRRQAELEQERRFFVGAVAHDLRTPLFSLRGYLEGLQCGIAATPEKVAHYLTICQEQAETLERLVADLFTYTRLEYLEQAPCHEPLELGNLLRGRVEGMRPRAEAKGIALVTDGPGVHCPLVGDSHLLARVVDNLLDNALTWTPPGAVYACAGSARMTDASSACRIAVQVLPALIYPASLHRSTEVKPRATEARVARD
jgi:signal transduction histidine kinase